MTKYLAYNWMGGVADHCLDMPREFYWQCGVGRLHDKELTPLEVQEDDVVFVKTDFVFNGTFQTHHLPQIKNPFILLTGASSYQVGKGASITPIIANPLVKKWYCTNAPLDVSDKIVPMPIGFEEMERPGGDQELIDKLHNERTPFENKLDKVLLPYHTLNTNPERARLQKSLAELPFVETQSDKLPFEFYVRNLDRYKFVICLEGSGPDVHRNYEALLMGTVPINVDNIIRGVFEEHSLPGEFIPSWEDLNEKYYSDLCQKNYYNSLSGDFLQTEYHMEIINENRSIKRGVTG